MDKVEKSIIAWGKSLYEELHDELKKVRSEEKTILQAGEEAVTITTAYLDVLKNYVLSKSFESKDEEIQFFKEVKPNFNAELIFYISLIKIESKRPEAGKKVIRKYLEKQLDHLNFYFEDNIEFYQYYRSRRSYLDEDYFTRNKFKIQYNIEPFVFDADPRFNTSHDYKVAKIIANERLSRYLYSAIIDLDNMQPALTNGIQETPKTKLSWTGSKTSLIELAYALQASGVFNNATADVRQIAEYLEYVFNVDLGKYYRTFQEIRIRKSGRTNFLDEMRKKLIQRMDESDENPKRSKVG